MEKAVFAGGCFWCMEAVFKMLRGVEKVLPGYSGGNADSPSYEEVSTGTTGNAESIEITFDPKEISYDDLLYVFFRLHDPTTKDRQGGDVGSQYRSAVFYMNDTQKAAAEKAIKEAQKEYEDPIVTEVKAFDKFYEAEGYHHDYYEKNKDQPYCKLVIDPKIEKLKKKFGKYLK